MLYQYTPKGQSEGIFDDYTGMGEATEPECGDVLCIYIRTRREIITEIGYTISNGACTTSKVCAAVVCNLALNKPVMEAYLVDADQIAGEIGDIPQAGKHCAMMAELSLKRAIVNYAKNR